MPRTEAEAARLAQDLLESLEPLLRDTWLTAGYHLQRARAGTQFTTYIMEDGVYMDEPLEPPQEGDGAA